MSAARDEPGPDEAPAEGRDAEGRDAEGRDAGGRDRTGIFVLGAPRSGTGAVTALLRSEGMRDAAGGGDFDSLGDTSALAAFNTELLAAAGGRWDAPPPYPPHELARVLAGRSDDARALFEEEMGSARGDGGDTWVWGDPRLCLLAPFWAGVLGAPSARLDVHRDPAETAAALHHGSGMSAPDALTLWDRYNRAALASCDSLPTLVLGYGLVRAAPEDAARQIMKALADFGVLSARASADAPGPLVLGAPDFDPGADRTPVEPATHHRVLARVLDRLDGIYVRGLHEGGFEQPGLPEELAASYDAEYYRSHLSADDVPYARDEPQWVDLFEAFARHIAEDLRPERVLDAGCAIGMLVESLRDRGVDARGFDISSWAIDQVPEPLRPYCWVASITDEIEGHYDLITCIEVTEHLPRGLAEEAIGNLCRHGDAVLFSSSPDDFDEPTHINVQPTEYWAGLFARHGFYRDFDHDAAFVGPHAIIFRRQGIDLDGAIEGYERTVWRGNGAFTQVRAERDAAVRRHEDLADTHNTLAAAYDRTIERLAQVELRRSAEAGAAAEEVQRLERHQQGLVTALNEREEALKSATAEIDAIYRTKIFRSTAGARSVYGRLRNMAAAPGPSPRPRTVAAPDPAEVGSYDKWVALYDTLDDDARDGIRRRLSALSDPPLVSVILPVYNTPEPFLRQAVDSVVGQLYPHWELCIADDCSTDPRVGELLAEYASSDQRISVCRRTENGHISASSNSALALAKGEWIASLDHDDVLAEHALAMAVLALSGHPDAGLLYTDEDKLDDDGRRHSPYFKPDFDPLLFLGQNYPCHLSMIRRDLVERVGGYRAGFEGSQDWDLILRVSERLTRSQVVHVPHVLYHWRVHTGSTASSLTAKPYAAAAGRQAVAEHLRRTGREARVTTVPVTGFNKVQWKHPDPAPRVSIVVPTHDGRYLGRCIDSVRRFTMYPNYEIVVVDNGSRHREVLEFLRVRDAELTVIRDERPFNFSALNNMAAERTTGDVLCLLNDDTEVYTGDWLGEMVRQLMQDKVGAVGAKLYFGDGRQVQHAGVVLGIGGVAAHVHRFRDRIDRGYFGRLDLAQHFSAVTAACMVVRREAWDEVGGLDAEHLPVAYNDIDFCLRLGEAGWRVVWTPSAELIHHESATRSTDTESEQVRSSPEYLYMQERWRSRLRNDPAYNPNLSMWDDNFALAFPPRTSYAK